MCELLVDVQVESGSFTGSPNGPTTVFCGSGRVIVAATAHKGSIQSGATAVPVELSDGALSDTCSIGPNQAVTTNYYLTTARVATL